LSEAQIHKAKQFRDMHTAGRIFVMPNAWNAGSACMLEAAGFSAIGTTSAGMAYGMAVPDYEGALTLDEAMVETRRITKAVSLPVSIDGENGYGHEPGIVANSIRQFAETGAVGASVEDYSGNREQGLYDLDLAIERIKAARAAADALDFEFTLTARAECYLVGHHDPFEESVTRANAYREAGADCLFVPGVKDVETIAALVKEINGPINIVMGLMGNPVSVNQLEDLGVIRVSIGGSLARATLGLIRRSAEELMQDGTFSYAKHQIPDSELCEFFAHRQKNPLD
jgi:2-methylisocitrate lyase-like PEP mutase family enzyme